MPSQQLRGMRSRVSSGKESDMKKRTVGILGASVDPAHLGHIAVAKQALTKLSLDEVWLMLTPQSTAKTAQKMEPVSHRLHLAHSAARNSGLLGSRLKVSEFEVILRQVGVPSDTAVVLEHFSLAYPELQPVWLMGSDNLAGLHTWGDRWMEIMERYPVAVFGRAGSNEVALSSEAAHKFAHARVAVGEFKAIPGTWCFLETETHPASSTAIRVALRNGIRPPHLTRDAYQYIKDYGLYQ
jgi:nicotinate-nucleotide adenylyltransferase